MKPKRLSEIIQSYIARYAYQAAQITTEPSSHLKMSIVIPCHNETNITDTLNSLQACNSPDSDFELIIVVNASEKAANNIFLQNKRTLAQIKNWINHSQDNFPVHVLDVLLPEKHAGVGLARKIGMDEAVYRFGQLNTNGVIVCLDADCTVRADYLQAIEQGFIKNTECKLASIYYEHPLTIAEPLKSGIIHYEIWLRYYVQALKYAHYPLAFHTVGSSMAVRTDAYCLSGGMNRRKAAEDFYFLHKVAQVRTLHTIKNTCVYPSARVSDRVPFGTGKAQKKWLMQAEPLIYNFTIFEDLKVFFQLVPKFFAKNCYEELPQSICLFMSEKEFNTRLDEIRKHSTHYKTFFQRFFVCWNGLKVLKFVHFASDNLYPKQHDKVALKRLFEAKKEVFETSHTLENHLYKLRDFDKEVF